MSRTEKGNKGGGYDYWKGRDLMCIDCPSERVNGRNKTLLHKKERAKSKQAIARGDEITSFAHEWSMNA